MNKKLIKSLVIIVLSTAIVDQTKALASQRWVRGLTISTPNGKVIQSTLNEFGYHVPIIEVNVSTVDHKQFTLELHLNSALLSAGYQEKRCIYHDDIYLPFNKSTDFCFYIGKVRGFKESTASLSTCDKVRGFFVADGNSYSITPVEGGSFRAAIVEKEEHRNFTCGVLNSLPTIVNRISKRSIGDKVDKTTRFIELYAVSDTTHLSQFPSPSDATQRIKEVVNAANALYNAVDIYLILVGIEVWQTPKILIDANNDTRTLYNFYDYKNNTLNANSPSHDNACLFLAVDFPGRTLGIAKMYSMCNSVTSGSFISDTHTDSISFAAATLTHEIGHNLGLDHDEDIPNCPCGDITGKCIMRNSSDEMSPPSTFSSCSKEDLVNKRSVGLDLCLLNFPNLMSPWGSPICGNGVIEQGEDCDCGGLPSDVCNKACCGADCKVIGSATCAMGPCCDVQNCNVIVANTICRASENSCDLPELCDGISGFCPANIYKHDGTLCVAAGKQAYCSKGQCQNHESQCQKIWMDYAPASPDFCYTRFNVLGDYRGSCNINLDPVPSFLPCDIKDVKCGQLFCEIKTKQTKLRSMQMHYFTNSKPTCASALFDFGNQILSPGFVPNGAVCGNSKMCVDQKCVDVSSVLSTNPCSSSCSVCDNTGQCRCENGLQYPNCNGETFTKIIPTTTATMITVKATTQTAVATTTPLALVNLSSQVLLPKWITFLLILLNAFEVFNEYQ